MHNIIYNDLDGAESCVQKVNHTVDLTAGGNGDYSVRAYLVTTCVQSKWTVGWYLVR